MILLAGKEVCFDVDERSVDKILIELTGWQPGGKMCEELFLESDSVATSYPQINKCDRSNFDTQDLDIVFEKLQGALKDNLSRERLIEIVNVLLVCYEPSS